MILIVCAILLQILKSGAEYLGAAGAIRLTVTTSEYLQSLVTNKIMSLKYEVIAGYPAGVLAAIVSQSDVIAQKLIVRIFKAGILSAIL